MLGRYISWAFFCALLLASLPQAPASTFKVLHAFTGEKHDGRGPYSGVTMARDGTVYGTTVGGVICSGTVYKIAPDGSYDVVYCFSGYDGARPNARVTIGPRGLLFGTTEAGGSKDWGTVFRLSTDGKKETVLHSFAGPDGGIPDSSVIFDGAGNLYGTTSAGGNQGCGGNGCGTVYRIAPDGTETVLYVFGGGADGASPGGINLDDSGDIVGVTYMGGDSPECYPGYTGCGVIFKISANGTETVLHTFEGGADGAFPRGGLINDRKGNFFGTTAGGGTGCGCGTVFELATDGAFHIAYAFKGSKDDGAYPEGSLLRDKKGAFVGSTFGGGPGCHRGGWGCGTIFRLDPRGETVLFKGFNKNNGTQPMAGLVADQDGNLYGTTTNWSEIHGAATVFEFTP